MLCFHQLQTGSSTVITIPPRRIFVKEIHFYLTSHLKSADALKEIKHKTNRKKEKNKMEHMRVEKNIEKKFSDCALTQ